MHRYQAGTRSSKRICSDWFGDSVVLGVIASNQYWPGYNDGFNHCAGPSYPQPNFPPGHKLFFYMSETSTTQTYFEDCDATTVTCWSTTDTNVGTWSYNTFQTMTESGSALTTGGSTNYESSFVYVGPIGCSPSCTQYNIGGTGTATPFAYGTLCSSASYSLGSWTNSYYGYPEPGFTIEGHCIPSVGGKGVLKPGDSHNYYSNPSDIIGFPTGQYTQLYGGNSGDGAWIIGNLQQTYTPTSTFTIMIHIKDYSSSYHSPVLTYVSTDNSTWTLVATTYVTNTSPAWLSFGSTSSSVQYIKILAEYYNGYSSDVQFDSVAITW